MQNTYGSMGQYGTYGSMGMYGSRRGYRLGGEESFDDYEESDHFDDESAEFVEEELTEEEEEQGPQFSDSIEREPSWERE